MERDGRAIDDQVLAALRAPTLSGMSVVMNPKADQPSHRPDRRDRLGSNSTGGDRRAQEAARQGGARATRPQIAHLLDGDAMTAGEHDDMVWIEPGQGQERINAAVESGLAELGIDSAQMIEDLNRGFAFRQQHQALVDRDSWLCGWFDALERFRCRGAAHEPSRQRPKV